MRKGTPKEIVNKFIKEYKEGSSITTIAYNYNCSAQTVWKYIKRAEVNRDMSETMSKHSLNKNYFDNINTEHKAYFLGLLYGDGSNDYGVKNNRMTITMIKEDALELLTVFKKEIGLSRNLIKSKGKKADGSEGSDLLTLTVYNKHMSKVLKDLGMIKNKHSTMVFPLISPTLYRHFVRGYFDADGSVTNARGFRCSLCSNSKQLLLDIKEVVNLKCNFYTRNQSSLNYILDYSSMKEARQFHSWMYSNSKIKLTRKNNV